MTPPGARGPRRPLVPASWLRRRRCLLRGPRWERTGLHGYGSPRCVAVTGVLAGPRDEPVRFRSPDARQAPERQAVPERSRVGQGHEPRPVRPRLIPVPGPAGGRPGGQGCDAVWLTTRIGPRLGVGG